MRKARAQARCTGSSLTEIYDKLWRNELAHRVYELAPSVYRESILDASESARRFFSYPREYGGHLKSFTKYSVIYEIAYINNFEYSRRRGCTTVRLTRRLDERITSADYY